MIYLASDHGGFELKEKIKSYLLDRGLEFHDLGPDKLNPKDDFPDFVVPLAEKVAENSGNLGIALCRNGVGVEIAANKIDGIRAALSWDPTHAVSSRHDDNSNVLALPADYLDTEKAEKVVDAWLGASYSHEERFERRIKKIEEEEQQ